jgi:ABC-type multidrug transport system fused ATPase/permease subunit
MRWKQFGFGLRSTSLVLTKRKQPHYGDLPPRTERQPGARGLLRAVRTSLAGVLLARQKPWIWLLFSLFLADIVVGSAVADVLIDLINHGVVLRDVPLSDYLEPTIVFGLLAMVIGTFLSMVTGRIGYVVEFDLRTWVYKRIQNTPPADLKAVTSGQMLTRVQQDLAAVDEMIKLAPSLVAMFPLLLALTVVVMIQSPIMGLVAISALPIDFFVLRRLRGRLRGLSWMELNESAEVTSAVVEPVLGIRVVHAFDRRDEHRSRLARVALRAYRVSMTKMRMIARFNVFLKSIPLLINAVALWVGAILVSSGDLTIGTFGFAIGLVVIITGAATQIDQIAVAWQLARGSQDRFAELLRLPQTSDTAGTASPPAPATGLRLDRITVRIGGRPVLDRLDLAVRPGELVVVTGPPGSGKSTLAGVLAGHVVADEGMVSLEGHPRSELAPASVQEAVRVVSETSVLFAGTVRDNVLLGVDHDLPSETLRAVL